MYYPSIGGSEIVCKNIAEYLATNHDIFVLTSYHKSRSQLTYPVISFRGPADYPSFVKHLNKIDPDVILIYSDVFYFFKQLITSDTKAKIILVLCGANWLYENQYFISSFKKNINKIHKIVCGSTTEREYKFCQNAGILDKVIMIPNGVNLGEFDHNNLSRKDLIPDCADKIWILNVSNFYPGKGQEHLIKILSLLEDKLSQLVYVQVASDIGFSIGQTLEESWQKKLIPLQKRGLTSKLFKNIHRSRIIGLFKNSNVFAFTSEKEVAPLVLLESMAAKLPWVATDVGNANELLGGKCIRAPKNSKNYSLFDDRVINLFAQYIQEYFLVSNLEAGRHQIEEKMTWDKILPQYASIIEN